MKKTTTTVAGVTFHRGIGGGRFAIMQNAEGHWRKIVETASGVVFVQRCDADAMPIGGFGVHCPDVADAVAMVAR